MSKIAVIGVGSPFADDHIAYDVIQLLQQEPLLSVSLQYYDRPGWYLLEYMQDFDVVHLIDAIISDKPIGTLHRYDDIDYFKTQETLLSSHNFGLAETLLLGQSLNQLPAQLVIHGIEIAVDSSDEAKLKEACVALVERIKQEIL
jgi:hydrogenase maturation protease